MSETAVLSTTHLEILGDADSIDLSQDPPALRAESTYTVRRRDGGPVQAGLAGALTVLPGAQEGRLRFGNFVGLADVDGTVLRVATKRIAPNDADVMLKEVIEALRGIPSRALPPAGGAFDRPLGQEHDVDFLAYVVVRQAVHGVGPHDLTAALGRILARPHERLALEYTKRPIWALHRIDPDTLIEIASGSGQRIAVPETSPLFGTPVVTRLKGTLPMTVRVSHSVPTTNTLENRFVATVLDRCLAITRNVAAHAAQSDAAGMVALQTEATAVARTLERWRRHRVLEDLQPLRRLPTTSTVLRGRPGYRHVLQLYADLIGRTRIVPPDVAARIVGMRDIAALYEWWCFAKVVDAVSELAGPPQSLTQSRQSWQGTGLVEGAVAKFSASARVEFNRTFSRNEKDDYRSYSVRLRPDILVEAHGKRYVFDAKFAFEPRSPAASDDNDDDDDEGLEDSPIGRARRWHIHKMHAYRDALEGVSSVRILYPGSTPEWYEATPETPDDGVGAMPLRPSNAADLVALKSRLAKMLGTEATGVQQLGPHSLSAAGTLTT